MKSVLVLFVLLLSSCAAVHSDADSKYEAALAYLDKDMQDKPFHVVDTLVYISQDAWYGEKSDTLNNKFNADFFAELDEKYKFENQYHSFKRSNKSGVYNIYFSKPIDNYLDVEMIHNKGNINYSHDYLSRYNTSFVYLFTFDENNKIIKVTEFKNSYD